MFSYLQRGVAASVLIAMVGFSSLLLASATPAAAASACAGEPNAIALSLVIDLEPGQNITLVGSGGPPFTASAHVTATCTLDNTPVSGAVVRVWASNSAGIDVTSANGSQTGVVIPPAMNFVVTSGTGATPPCGSPASALNFCDVTTDASGAAAFTITSPSANPAALNGPVLIGSHREQVRQAFGTTLVDPNGVFIGPVNGGSLFASVPAATPELDSFVLFGVGALALAGAVRMGRRASTAP